MPAGEAPPRLTEVLNAAHEVEFEGQTYRLREPSIDELAAFSTWLEDRAREYAGRAADMPDGGQDRLFRGAMRDAVAGHWEWGGEGFAQALQTPRGVAKLVHLTLTADGLKVTERQVRRLVDARMREIAGVLVAEEEQDPFVVAVVFRLLGMRPPGSSAGSSASATPPSAPPPTSPPSAGSPSASSPGSTPSTSGGPAGTPG